MATSWRTSGYGPPCACCLYHPARAHPIRAGMGPSLRTRAGTARARRREVGVCVPGVATPRRGGRVSGGVAGVGRLASTLDTHRLHAPVPVPVPMPVPLSPHFCLRARARLRLCIRACARLCPRTTGLHEASARVGRVDPPPSLSHHHIHTHTHTHTAPRTIPVDGRWSTAMHFSPRPRTTRALGACGLPARPRHVA